MNPIVEDLQIAMQEHSDLAACERMLSLLNSQIAELDLARATLVDMRGNWSARLDAARQGRMQSPVPDRAPRGAVRHAILTELRRESGGLTVDQLVNLLASNVGNFNRRSVSTALGRLRNEGLADYRDSVWHFSTPSQ